MGVLCRVQMMDGTGRGGQRSNGGGWAIKGYLAYLSSILLMAKSLLPCSLHPKT